MNNQEECICSFCGKSIEDVVCMIRGNDVYICDSCIEDAKNASEEFKLKLLVEQTILKLIRNKRKQ